MSELKQRLYMVIIVCETEREAKLTKQLIETVGIYGSTIKKDE